MKTLLATLFVIIIAGCVSPAKQLKSISEVKEGYGMVSISFESSWPYKNESIWGRPLSIVYYDGKGGIGHGTIPYTGDPRPLLLELPAGTFEWTISIIDQRVYSNTLARFEVSKGEVTNLGKVYIDIQWDEGGGPVVHKLTQSGFGEVEKDLVKKGVENIKLVNRKCLFKGKSLVRMSNSVGNSYLTPYKCSKRSLEGTE
ncbi:hypothetical protein [Kangiella marina]|uniref:DUF2846 domain-containing protein n=1 Tax=Kangiella marina TaxID=1079178 RepID=A0ABP8INM0_9GAMM